MAGDYETMEQDELRDAWDELDSPVIDVLDETGANVGHAQLRALPDGRYLYVDDMDGFEVVTSKQADWLGRYS